MVGWILLGFIVGVAASVPVAALFARRRTRHIRHLEQQARSTERLAELGMLTGGLAHEIKNPLSTIGLNLQLLREDLDELTECLEKTDDAEHKAGRLHRRFDALSREIQRLRDILEDFLRFAGRMKLDRLNVDINQLTSEVADFFEPQASAAGVHLRVQLDADSPTVALDADLFKQALLNLLLNAVQAMAEARRTSAPNGGADELLVRTHLTRTLGQPEMVVLVSDTGPGIEAATAEKIFAPYFSTKRGGTGLGLPTTRRIIEEHGGRITVHSEPGKGTEFRISLPLEHQPQEREAAQNNQV